MYKHHGKNCRNRILLPNIRYFRYKILILYSYTYVKNIQFHCPNFRYKIKSYFLFLLCCCKMPGMKSMDRKLINPVNVSKLFLLFNKLVMMSKTFSRVLEAHLI